VKDYKFFMNVLMESDIIADTPHISYVHMDEIELNFQSRQYFKAVMHLACLIQSNIYQLLLKKLPQPPQNFKAVEVKKIQNLPFGLLIDWVGGKPISKKQVSLVCYPTNWKVPLLTEDEKLILHNLKEIRNDMAHIPYLTYDTNLRKEVVRKIIDEVCPIHHKLVEEIIKNRPKP